MKNLNKRGEEKERKRGREGGRKRGREEEREGGREEEKREYKLVSEMFLRKRRRDSPIRDETEPTRVVGFDMLGGDMGHKP